MGHRMYSLLGVGLRVIGQSDFSLGIRHTRLGFRAVDQYTCPQNGRRAPPFCLGSLLQEVISQWPH